MSDVNDRMPRPIDQEKAQEFWRAEYATLSEDADTEMHVVRGALLPIWKLLAGVGSSIFKVETDDGERFIAASLKPHQVESLQNILKVHQGVTLTGPEIVAQLTHDDWSVVTLDDCLKVSAFDALGHRIVRVAAVSRATKKEAERVFAGVGIVPQKTTMGIPYVEMTLNDPSTAVALDALVAKAPVSGLRGVHFEP